MSDVYKMSTFWTKKKSAAACLLAEGESSVEVAQQIGVCKKTVLRWEKLPEFSAEVNRLSAMVAVASKAERLRSLTALCEKRSRARTSNQTETF